MILSNARTRYLAILVNFIIPLAGISSDIYLPSLPALKHYFHTNVQYVQWTVTAFVLAMGLTQLFAGPVSDAVGRKRQLLCAIVVQIISLIAMLLISNIVLMMVFRFTQGVGAAFMVVAARAINNDILSGKRLKIQINYTTVCYALAPIVGPFIGGYLQHYIGWQANFIFILIYNVVLLLLIALSVPETIALKKTFQLKHYLHNSRHLVQSRFYILGVLMAGFGWGYGAVFYVIGPFLIQETLGKTAIVYGRVALILGVGWFLGNLANRFINAVPRVYKTQVNLWVLGITTLLMLLFAAMGYLNLWLVIAPLFVMNLFASGIFSTYVAESLALFKDLAASANGLLFSFTWFVFAAFTVLGSFLKSSSILPLAICYFVLSVVSIGFYYLFLYQHDKAK